MGSYTVPQNVEVEDKLLGPFGFRQFIYLMIAAAFCGIGWGLSLIHIVLVILVVPFAGFFILLAMPFSKDQPMEVKVGAFIHFLRVNHTRTWRSDGIEKTVKIDSYEKITDPPIKDLSQAEATKRLAFLSEVIDSEGWSTRGQVKQENNKPFHETIIDTANKIDTQLNHQEIAINNEVSNKVTNTTNLYKEQLMQDFNNSLNNNTNREAENGE